MINRRELVRALQRQSVTEWVVIERVQELAFFDEGRGVRRHESRKPLTLVVHQDFPRGRGSARFELAAEDGDAVEVVTRAVQLAEAVTGSPWKSRPPSAPAKVRLLDPALADVDLGAMVVELVRKVRRPDRTTVRVAIELMRELVNVQSRTGLDAKWTASRIRADMLVMADRRSIAFAREARLVAHLQLDPAVAAASTDLVQLAIAKAPVPGRAAVVLTTEALLHGGSYGLWAIFATQADAILERQGLTRYRRGHPIAPNATSVSEPLTIYSDGALDHGTRSAPIGEHGDAIRRFAIIERGVATGYGLSAREAALRNQDPNGGVLNLVVTPGTWDETVPAGRTIEVKRLRGLAIDPYTGDATLDIALGIDHDAGSQRPFTGGMIRLDLVVALAGARRSANLVRRDAYEGPAAVLIEAADLVS